jgi:hypothetical protein
LRVVSVFVDIRKLHFGVDNENGNALYSPFNVLAEVRLVKVVGRFLHVGKEETSDGEYSSGDGDVHAQTGQ